MSLERDIKRIAEKIVAENDEIQAFLVIDKEGLIIYSSLDQKKHSDIFGALAKDIFEKIKPLGQEMEISSIKALQVKLSDYIFHIFRMQDIYILLLKGQA